MPSVTAMGTRDGFFGVLGLALAAVTAVTLVSGPVRAEYSAGGVVTVSRVLIPATDRATITMPSSRPASRGHPE